MAESILDPFRDEILSWNRAGVKQKDILTKLQTEHDLQIGKTRLSDFIRAETAEVSASGASSSADPGAAAAPDYSGAIALMQSYSQDAKDIKDAQVALYRLVQGVSEKLGKLEIPSHTTPSDSRPSPALVKGIWKRAVLSVLGAEFMLWFVWRVFL